MFKIHGMEDCCCVKEFISSVHLKGCRLGLNDGVDKPAINWKSCLTALAAFGIFYGAYFTFSFKIYPSIFSKKRNVSTNCKMTLSTEETCPVCLEPPQIGIRTACGHRMCTNCLLKLWKTQRRNGPPPCPLCRAPLVSVSITYDQIKLSSSDHDGYDNVDPALLQWVQEYNDLGGCANAAKTNFCTLIILKLMVLTILFGLVAKSQFFLDYASNAQLAVYSSAFVATLGMFLLVYLCQKLRAVALIEVMENDDFY